MSLFPIASMPAAPHLASAPSSFAGSASSLSPDLAPRPGQKAPKRKREASADGEDSAQDSGTQTPPAQSRPSTRDSQKKKKASRACVHCQKSHLTCDDGAHTSASYVLILMLCQRARVNDV
jgi:hypothetical protein